MSPKRPVIGIVPAIMLLLAATQARAAEAPHLKLIRVLPSKVSGFVADKPEGTTTKAMGLDMAEASRVYSRGKGTASQSVTIKITDGANSEFLPTDPDPAAEFNNDDADGVQRSFTLDGYPALERYDKPTKAGSLLVFVGGRYLIEIETKNLDRKSLQQWWKKIAVKQLAKHS